MLLPGASEQNLDLDSGRDTGMATTTLANKSRRRDHTVDSPMSGDQNELILNARGLNSSP